MTKPNSFSPRSSRVADTAALCAVIFIFVFLVYISLGSQQRFWDGPAVDIARVTRHTPDAESRHLLFTLVGVPFYQLWQSVGYTGEAALPLQTLNAFLGAVASSLMALTVHRLTSRPFLAVLGAFFFAFSYGIWYFTVDAFYNVMALPFLIAAFLLTATLIETPDETTGRSKVVLAATFMAVSTMVSLEHIVPTMSIACALAFLGKAGGKPIQWRRALSFLMAYVLWLLIGYGLFGWLVVGNRSLRDFAVWLRPYDAASLPMFATFSAAYLPQALKSFASAILPFWRGMRLRQLLAGVVSPDHLAAQIALALLAAGGVLGALWALAFHKRLWARHSRILILCFLWFSTIAVFATWSDPWGPERWLAALIPLTAAIALVLADILDATSSLVSRVVKLVTALAVGLVFLSNLSLAIAPDHYLVNQELAIARCAAAKMQPDDILIAPTWGWARYLPTLDRQVIFLLEMSGHLYGRNLDAEGLIDALRQKIELARSRGKIYLVDTRTYTEDAWQIVQLNTGLTREQFDLLERAPAWQCEGEQVWRVLNVKPAQASE